jgi:hypothetical protein
MIVEDLLCEAFEGNRGGSEGAHQRRVDLVVR